ncbi:MAG: D-alanyl-D-alanine carboxypeptidase family protein [Gammaproteobacteria bacterium]|nr:D-alanyl-D-alanine carboxypeptidase family protein [Gammaproteobacteria bacterium]
MYSPKPSSLVPTDIQAEGDVLLNTNADSLPLDYATRIALIHRELGIPKDYARQFQLSLRAEAQELTSIGADVYGRVQHLQPHAARSWQAMRSQAQRENVLLLVISAFRSVDYQRGVIARKLASGKTIGEILRVNAAPGYSEHHTGCALDLTTSDQRSLETAFENTSAFAWLRQNAGHFGFSLSYPRNNPHGIAYEPWHWACMEG